jgi:hypothetical protein
MDRELKAHGQDVKDIYVYPLVREARHQLAVITHGKQILRKQFPNSTWLGRFRPTDVIGTSIGNASTPGVNTKCSQSKRQ